MYLLHIINIIHKLKTFSPFKKSIKNQLIQLTMGVKSTNYNSNSMCGKCLRIQYLLDRYLKRNHHKKGVYISILIYLYDISFV